MKILVKKTVKLDFEGSVGVCKTYVNGEHEIDDKIAIERNYVTKYQKHPSIIEILEFPVVDETPTDETPVVDENLTNETVKVDETPTDKTEKPKNQNKK